MLVGTVIDTYEIGGRGIVVMLDRTCGQVGDLRLRTGDPVELRLDGLVALRSTVVGIEHCDPWSPNRAYAFLLPPDLTKADVPIGAEVWLVE